MKLVDEVQTLLMTDKKLYRYTNVELLDAIKNGQGTFVKQAKAELEKRNLSAEELETAELEYVKYAEYQEKRKDEPLTKEEWLSFFILPFFTPKPRWRNDHFSESEYERFAKYGFDKKAQQASEVRILGFLFWVVVILVGLVVYGYFF